MAAHFHPLTVKRVAPDAAGAAAITFAVPDNLRGEFNFKPGQFLTLRANIEGEDVRRSYSICSPVQRYRDSSEIDVGIKRVEGGTFSRWALEHLEAGQRVDVMPPDGRFTVHAPNARHRVGFAAGSGITPILSIIASTLAQEPHSLFTLVYCNQRIGSIMFNEVLQDLKDRYPARLALVHVLSRQSQEIPLLHGRLDEAKVNEILQTLLPASTIDEAFICGPEGMIEGTERALRAAGVPLERIHAERFVSPGDVASAAKRPVVSTHTPGEQPTSERPFRLEVVIDGKTHALSMGKAEHVLDVALDAGLDLPYSCRGGVCCTCRARVIEGRVEMEKNFTLEQWEIDKGFVLTCQSKPLTEKVVVSYDER